MSKLLDWLFGRQCWRVRYCDGVYSVYMQYDEAKGYAAIFGGTVEHISHSRKK